MVSFGAILGANTRFLVYTELQKKNLSKDFIVFLINVFSSFGLGFFYSLASHFAYVNYYYKVSLFFSIGFLGSFSTFSTFVYHLFDLYKQDKFIRAIKLLIFSLVSGIAIFFFGYILGQ